MTQETNELVALGDGQQFISVSAGSDGSIWGINLAGALLAASFTHDANTGERQVTWQPTTSKRTWKVVSAGEEVVLWCLDNGGIVYQIPTGESAGEEVQLGNMTLAFLSAGADGTVWGLDASGKAFLYVRSQSAWAAQTQPRPFTRLSVADATHVVALDSDGGAYALDQSGWQNIGSGLIDISAQKDAYTVAIGNKGNLMIQVDDGWFDGGGEGWKTISSGSFSNLVVLDDKGNFTDLAKGRLMTLGTGRAQSPRFDTKDPFNEKVSTHLWLVNRGAMLAGGDFGDKFRRLFQPDPNQTEPGGSVFHQAVCQGLYDADFITFYNGPPSVVYRQPSWESHFYDPDTGLNWRGRARQTALTRGRDLFNSALESYRVGRLEAAGYALGVSLHYLTDLGQPMHAANFTAVSIPMFWHGHFEEMVMAIQDQCPMPETQTPDDVTNIPVVYFINLARKSKAMFLDPVIRAFKRFPDLGELGKDPSVLSAAVQTLLQPMLTNTIQAVAQYVTEWMKRAEDVSFLAHAPICAGHQGPYWRSGLWSLDQQGQLQYYHTDQNAQRAAVPPNRESWYSDQKSMGANPPAAPTQIAACMNEEEYDGRATMFALSGGDVYYTTQLSRYLSQDDKDVSGWTPWTMLQNTTKLKLICACPYTYGRGQVVTTGASVWGVGEDGVLRFAYQHSKTDGKSFDPYNTDAIVWSDWQVDNSAPKNVTCIAATGTGSTNGYIFGLVDGDLYSTLQTEPRNSGGWGAWAKLEIPGPAVKLRLITACEAIHLAGYIAQIWGVDDQGILRTATYSSVDKQWSPWSGDWTANAPRDIVALTSSGVTPGADFFQLWALAGGKLHSIFQTQDATTKQTIWTDWTAFPVYDAAPLAAKVSLPIGPLKLTIAGRNLDFLVMLITDDPDHPTEDPTSAIRNIRMAITENPGPDDWMPGKLNLVTGELSDVTDHTGNFTTTYQGKFDDNTHGSGTLSDRGLDQWTASPLTPSSTGPAILSVFPADQVAVGSGQLLLIRGTALPGVVVFSQDGHDHPPQWTAYAKPEAALVRLPVELHPGPATVRVSSADGTVSTAEFPITVSATPGAPKITAVTSFPGLGTLTKIVPGQKIAITAEGMDTSGAIIEWTHSDMSALKSASELTANGVGGNFCVVTTVPNVTPNDTWALSLRLSVVRSGAISSAFTLPLQT